MWRGEGSGRVGAGQPDPDYNTRAGKILGAAGVLQMSFELVFRNVFNLSGVRETAFSLWEGSQMF